MTYFQDEKNVMDYIKMAKGYDGKELIEILKKYLLAGSSVLELGMGPGVDLDLLSFDYKVTGSDYSSAFLDLYKSQHEEADLLLLDAVTIETERKFDCIYSNKVLIHLTKQELIRSLKRQYEVLNQNGLVFHSFWKGNKTEDIHGLHFVYYTINQLSSMFAKDFKIIDINSYTEMENNDSIYVLAKKI